MHMSPSRSTPIPAEERRHHERIDPHYRGRWLAEAILGGQDGLVNVLGVVLGVVAATRDVRVVLAAGLAAALAESVSMAAVAYTSSAASGDLYRSERAREYRHIDAVPRLEREEVRAIYARKGFSGPLLDRIVDTITADRDVWVAVMMTEEHRLTPVDRRKSMRASLIVGLSSLIGSVLPLAPFVLFPIGAAAVAAVVVTSGSLFGFGVFKARMTTGHTVRSGLELALIGTLTALLGYGVGTLFRVPTCP
jgi:VIT1/CCC1 family predicted Fe2+/Mn2+ transporter